MFDGRSKELFKVFNCSANRINKWPHWHRNVYSIRTVKLCEIKITALRCL